MDIAYSLQGLGNFLAYFVAALLAETVFLTLYMAVTPLREAALIRSGNCAAAASLGGAAIGFTLPLASAIANSVSFLDMVVWSVVALVVQLAVFLGASLAFRGLSQRIVEGNVATGLALAATSIAIGVLNAASMTY